MSNAPNQAELVRQASSGERAALSQLLLAHYDALQNHIRRRISADLQGLVSPEDVLHQTFVRVAQKIGSFELRHSGAFRGWIERIADNLIRDIAKRRRRERRARPAPEGGASGSGGGLDALDRIPRDSTSPSRRIQQAESVRRMQAALASLSEEQRDVIHRYYILGQSLDQIAKATGKSRDAIRGISYRARKNLRSIMGHTSFYFSG